MNHEKPALGLRRRACLKISLVGCLPVWASAQERWPGRPLQLIAPIAPGGLTDTLARLLASGLSTRLDQQVVVENKPGGAGVIGMQAAARSAPDGYHLILVYQGVASVNPVLYKNLPYDTLRDFAPVAQVATFPMALIANSRLQAKNLKEFIALARAKPGALSYASAGNATTSHLTMELFKRRTNLQLTHIPYKGEAPALNDLMGGQIDVAFSSLGSIMPHLDSGRLKVYGITSQKRTTLAPELPTISEAGVAGFQSEGWYAVLAPAGTPAPIITRLNKELLAVLAEPEVRARMQTQAIVPGGSSPEGLRQWIISDTERWRKVIADAGIKTD